jgi:hypothetical protein
VVDETTCLCCVGLSSRWAVIHRSPTRVPAVAESKYMDMKILIGPSALHKASSSLQIDAIHLSSVRKVRSTYSAAPKYTSASVVRHPLKCKEVGRSWCRVSRINCQQIDPACESSGKPGGCFAQIKYNGYHSHRTIGAPEDFIIIANGRHESG